MELIRNYLADRGALAIDVFTAVALGNAGAAWLFFYWSA